MSEIRDSIRRFRRSRPVNVLTMIVVVGVGPYNVVESGTGDLVIGLFFLIVGMLGLYNQFVGESAVETAKSNL